MLRLLLRPVTVTPPSKIRNILSTSLMLNLDIMKVKMSNIKMHNNNFSKQMNTNTSKERMLNSRLMNTLFTIKNLSRMSRASATKSTD